MLHKHQRIAWYLCCAILIDAGGCYVGSESLPELADGGGAGTDTGVPGSNGSADGGGEGEGEGGGNDPTDGGPADAACDHGRNAGPSELKRLSAREFSNTVTDLLGIAAEHGEFITSYNQVGFVGAVTALSDPSELGGYSQIALQLADQAVDTLPELQNPDDLADAAYVADFIEDFGQRAYRRPLTSVELERYQALYDESAEAYGPKEGMAWVIHAFLSAPNFVYHFNQGTGEADESGLMPLTDYSLASRLSYLLTGSMPDSELFDAAQQGLLSDPEQIEYHARRLLRTPRGHQQVVNFFEQWLEVESVDSVSEGRIDGFAPDSPTIKADLRDSLATMIDHVMWNSSGTFEELMTSPTFFANESLAAAWGLDGAWDPQSSVFERPDEFRFGVLTHPAVLAVHSADNFASSSWRGKFINARILCTEVPEPEDDVMNQFPEIDALLETDRATMESLHQEVPVCQGCHGLLDPPGFAFENFDSGGRFRATQENIPGSPASVDASGVLNIDGQSIAFEGPEAFAAAIGQSKQVQNCLSNNLFRFATRRHEKKGIDDCSLAQFRDALPETNVTIEDMFVALTATDAFLYMGQAQE